MTLDDLVNQGTQQVMYLLNEMIYDTNITSATDLQEARKYVLTQVIAKLKAQLENEV